MTKLINGAYSEMQHAPLRYYVGADPADQGRNRGSTCPRANEATGSSEEVPFAETDRLEFWVRFACGA